jgi:REP element-mobilizing transposase RayT
MLGVPQRISARLPAFDYTRPGAYFVTVCTHERRCVFGRVQNRGVLLSKGGQIVEEEWLRTAEKRPYVMLDSYVIMPNHVHGVIIIQEHVRPSSLTRSAGLTRQSLSSIVGGFKAAASRRIALLTDIGRPHLWQRGYHEHIVRNDDDLRSIREYIANNPARWRQG